ncbi:hypothetical protein RKD29_001936 [Streptomyces tendae]
MAAITIEFTAEELAELEAEAAERVSWLTGSRTTC